MDMEAIREVAHSAWENPLFRIAVIVAGALFIRTFMNALIDSMVRRIVKGHKFKRAIDEQKREDTLVTIFHTAAAVVLWAIVVIIVLWQLHVNLAALMTGAGLVGIVVGFGAQHAIRDFLAGIFILIENQYRVGDIVSLRVAGKDFSGVVEDITIRITKLRDLDGNLHIIQNGVVSPVTNLSFDFANVNVDVSVSYDDDVDKVERVMNKIGCQMKDDPKWASAIEEPIQFMRVDGFEESGVRIKALGKVEPAQQWDVAGEFRRRLKRAFEKEGITIPYPQRVLHHANTKPSRRPSK